MAVTAGAVDAAVAVEPAADEAWLLLPPLPRRSLGGPSRRVSSVSRPRGRRRPQLLCRRWRRLGWCVREVQRRRWRLRGGRVVLQRCRGRPVLLLARPTGVWLCVSVLILRASAAATSPRRLRLSPSSAGPRCAASGGLPGQLRYDRGRYKDGRTALGRGPAAATDGTPPAASRTAPWAAARAGLVGWARRAPRWLRLRHLRRRQGLLAGVVHADGRRHGGRRGRRPRDDR